MRSFGFLLDDSLGASVFPGSGASFSTLQVDSLNGFIVGTSGLLGATTIGATSPIYFASGIIGISESPVFASLALTSLTPTTVNYTGTSGYITGSSLLTWDGTRLKAFGNVSVNDYTSSSGTYMLQFSKYFGSEAGTSGIPNKIGLFQNSSNVSTYGFGIESGTLAYVSAGTHRFYRGVSMIAQWVTGNFTTYFNANIVGTLGVSGVVTLDNLTASQLVATNASKQLVSTSGISYTPIFASMALTSLTPTTVLYAGTSGYITGASAFTWDGSTLKIFGDVFAATGWTKIRIDVNAAGTAATLSINGTAAGGLTTNIPVGASNIISPSISLRKTVGTNNAYMAVDYYRHGIRFTTSR